MEIGQEGIIWFACVKWLQLKPLFRMNMLVAVATMG